MPKSCWSLCFLFVVGLCLTGCTPRPVELKGDSSDAIESLKLVLEEWKQGTKPEDLADQDPQIIVRDEDWEAGAQLKSYEIQPEAIAEGGNWRVFAQLELTGKGQSSRPKQVSYTVGVEPVVSVFRMDVIE